jgi:hypothetical protein
MRLNRLDRLQPYAGMLRDALDNRWVAANVAMRVVLVFGLISMVTEADHHWTDGSKLVRGIAYPIFAAAVPFLYLRHRLEGSYPVGVDLTWNFIFVSDLVASNLGLYGTWYEYKFLVHFSNGLLITVVIMAAIGALHHAGIGRPFAGRENVMAFSLLVAGHTVWEAYEWVSDWLIGTEYVRGGMPETLLDTVAASTGALLALALLQTFGGKEQWQRHVVSPLGDFLRDVRRA